MLKRSFLFSFSLVVLLSLLGGKVWAEPQIIINIPAFTLYLYDQGVPIKSYPISIGTELNPSRLGETEVINKVVDPTYYPPQGGTPILPGPDNPVGTRWLGLGFSGYGIHGTNNPNSIGRAASAGCIRLRNEDVEELTELVAVGTMVKLIYQTVLVQEDPLLHTKTITVYPDVYNQGVSPVQLQEEIGRQEWGNVFWPAMLSLLRAPTGKPYALALALSLSLNGQVTGLVGVKWQENYYLPYDRPFDLRSAFASDVVKWGDEYYLPLEAFQRFTGLGFTVTQEELSLYSPFVYLGERFLGPGLVFQDSIYYSPLAPSYQLIPGQMQILSLWGQVYLPVNAMLSASDLSELRLKWPEGVLAPTY